ncbi:peptide ABC transporter substrate-binding protein [Fusibacter sp. JL298sf-3]
MKRILSLLLVFVLVSALFAGCSKDGEETGGVDPSIEQVLKWNVGADPKTIDPTLNGASDGGDVINQTFEGLTRERSGEVQPGIAESWDVSEDGLTITFHLRESKWSDGSDLTANDFVYGWKRGMDPATASEYAWIWEYTNIVNAFEAVNGEASLDDVGIKAEDDHTLVVNLSTPTDYIVSLLSFYHFMPIKQSAAESKADGLWARDPELAVSNGPFVLTSYEIGKGLTLEKNPNYWNAENVKLDRIEAVFVDEASTAYQAYQNDELYFLPSVAVPTAEIPKLIAESSEFYVYPLLGTYYYNFNLNLDLWKDPNIRRALTLAIDRELICETKGAGEIPAVGMVPPGFKDADGNDFFETAGTYGIVTDGSKVEEAQKLLADAGYPGGEGFPEFTIMYNTSEGHQLVAEMIQEMFKTNLGIETKLENQEWAVFQDTRKVGDYEFARGGWLTDFMDPSGLLSIFTTGNAYNDPKFSNAEYDQLLSESSKTRGKEHFDLLYKAQDILMSELPIMPIYHYSDYMLSKDKVKDWDRSVLGTIDFSTAYIGE